MTTPSYPLALGSSFRFMLLLASLLFLPTAVQAHGYVQNVSIAGKEYTGWLPWTMPYTDPIGKSIVRTVPGDGPITDINSPDLACNQGGEKAAALIANANAGDRVNLTMNTWPADHIGPVTVYMASCSGNCMTFDPSKGSPWFKIDEFGLKNGVWGTGKLIAQGNSWIVDIPKTIQAGQYLLRLELLALHNAGQPQFYPSCTQLNIASSGSSAAGPLDLVAIPGVYKNAGKAIDGDVWSGTPTSWPVAGPAVVSFASSAGQEVPAGSKSTTPAHSSSTVPASSQSPTTTTAPTSVGTGAGRVQKTASQTLSESMTKPLFRMPDVVTASTPVTSPASTSSASPSSSSVPPRRCKPKAKRAFPRSSSSEHKAREVRRASINVHEPFIARNEVPAFDTVHVPVPGPDSDPELDTFEAYERPPASHARRLASSPNHRRRHNVLQNKRGGTARRIV